MAGPAARPSLRPFEIGTDIRWEPLGAPSTGAFTVGGSDSVFNLNKTGLLAWLKQVLTITDTQTGAGTFAAFGPWSIFKRMRLVTNMNNIVPIDLAGYSMYLVNCLLSANFAPDISGSGGGSTVDADLYAAALAAGANTWQLNLDIPVTLNMGPQRRYGVINMQDPTIQVQHRVTPGAAADAVATGTPAFSASSLLLYQGNWEIPPAQQYELPIGPGKQTIHYLLEKQFPLTFTGDQILTVDRDQARLLRLVFYALVNGVRSNLWSQFKLRYDVTNIPLQLDRIPWKMIQRILSDLDWVDGPGSNSAPRRNGAFFLDRWSSASLLSGLGPFWDSILIPSISQIDFVPTIPTGTALAAGDVMTLIREELSTPQGVVLS